MPNSCRRLTGGDLADSCDLVVVSFDRLTWKAEERMLTENEDGSPRYRPCSLHVERILLPLISIFVVFCSVAIPLARRSLGKARDINMVEIGMAAMFLEGNMDRL